MVSRFLNKPKSAPISYVFIFSHDRDELINAGEDAVFVLTPLTSQLPLAVPIGMLAYVGYQLFKFWLPNEPNDPLILKLLIEGKVAFQKSSWATFHPIDADGK